jgi:NAD(P)-dependent dehydrogenase (short-subunit alcohol dehydrogenase family)
MATFKNFDLSGKVAVITGGAGLLGTEHAIALAQAGADVVITDINVEAAQKAAQKISAEYGFNKCLGLHMDVTNTDSVRGVRDELLARYRAVHILVNNAAVDSKVKEGSGLVESSRFENFPLDQWRFQLEVGLTGAFLCSQAFGGWMASHDGGVILNIASDLSVFAPDQRIYRKEGLPESQQPVKPVTYSVIKTALVGLTRYLATYWADRNVRVNALSPGGVYVNQPEEFVHKLTNLIPMGRMARREEYRGAVQFLCSEASSYMTGQNIVIDGGRSVW